MGLRRLWDGMAVVYVMLLVGLMAALIGANPAELLAPPGPDAEGPILPPAIDFIPPPEVVPPDLFVPTIAEIVPDLGTIVSFSGGGSSGGGGGGGGGGGPPGCVANCDPCTQDCNPCTGDCDPCTEACSPCTEACGPCVNDCPPVCDPETGEDCPCPDGSGPPCAPGCEQPPCGPPACDEETGEDCPCPDGSGPPCAPGCEQPPCGEGCEGDACPEKVDLCHIPPGNPENAHTIRVSVHAVPAHLGHGDAEGACPVDEGAPQGEAADAAGDEAGGAAGAEHGHADGLQGLAGEAHGNADPQPEHGHDDEHGHRVLPEL